MFLLLKNAADVDDTISRVLEVPGASISKVARDRPTRESMRAFRKRVRVYGYYRSATSWSAQATEVEELELLTAGRFTATYIGYCHLLSEGII